VATELRVLVTGALAAERIVIRGEVAALRRNSREDAADALTFLSKGLDVLPACWPVAAAAGAAEPSSTGTETSNARN